MTTAAVSIVDPRTRAEVACSQVSVLYTFANAHSAFLREVHVIEEAWLVALLDGTADAEVAAFHEDRPA